MHDVIGEPMCAQFVEFMAAWSRHENAARITCPDCHFESSEGYPPSHAPDCPRLTDVCT